MTAKKVAEGDSYRLIRVSEHYSAVERKDGYDWLGKPRWHCLVNWLRRAKPTDRIYFEGREFISRDRMEEIVRDVANGIEREGRAQRKRARARANK
tara:strand:+ start:276 stop:563 length:288 start_codon:yes stop_codon:yes gene_type:complete